MSDVLVLDSAGEPSYTTTWDDAVRLYFLDKAEVLEEDFEGRILHSDSFEMNMPRVVQLKNWVMRKLNVRVPLSRRNLVVRDSILVHGVPTLVCQYCSIPLTTETYSVDHIVPRCKGGITEWTNVVACCKDCNSLKANKSLEEAHMQPIKTPIEPSSHDVKFRFRLNIRNPRPEWVTYLYWNVELEK